MEELSLEEPVAVDSSSCNSLKQAILNGFLKCFCLDSVSEPPTNEEEEINTNDPLLVSELGMKTQEDGSLISTTETGSNSEPNGNSEYAAAAAKARIPNSPIISPGSDPQVNGNRVYGPGAIGRTPKSPTINSGSNPQVNSNWVYDVAAVGRSPKSPTTGSGSNPQVNSNRVYDVSAIGRSPKSPTIDPGSNPQLNSDRAYDVAAIGRTPKSPNISSGSGSQIN